jgi:prophage tail gpP-like protein
MSKTQFEVGDEVVVHSAYEHGAPRFDKVAKVHKNGNIILTAVKGQWRPNCYRSWSDPQEVRLSAHPTGQSFSRYRPHVTLKSENELAKLEEEKARRDRTRRLAEVKAKVEAIHRNRDLSEEVLQALEAAVALTERREG